MTQQSNHSPSEALHDIAEGYSHGAPRPLTGYLMLMGSFISLFLGFVTQSRIRKQPLPERFRPADLLLLGTATFHFGRILAKAGVTSPLRAPFTEFKGPSDPPAEVKESVRGRGIRHALGELLTCPFCLGLWVAALFSYGLVLAPRITRLAASIFVVDAISDTLNLIYDAVANVAVKTPDILQENASPSNEE